MSTPDKPSSRQRARAGAVVAVVLLLIIVLTFVGRNIGHYQELQEQHQTGATAPADETQQPHHQ